VSNPSDRDSLLSSGEVNALIRWFGEHAVDYPWGEKPTPYRVWISEIMLQQTVVTAAVNHFTRWMELFPDIPALAGSDEQQVLKAWEGLGYYSRARNIRKGALYLMEHHGGVLPSAYEDLIHIPGIGDYTARAILSLAFFKPYPVLDANVRRIGQRLRGRAEWGPGDDRALLEDLDSLIPHDNPGTFNCALMQLGQLVCRVRSPGCGICPLSESCRTRREGLQDIIPRPRVRKVKEKSSALILLISEGRLLLTRRSSGIGRGLWFIPAVPLEDREKVLKQLEPLILDRKDLARQTHLYTTWKETLHPVRLDLSGGEYPTDTLFNLPPGDPTEWVPLEDLEAYPCPSVYRTILIELSGGTQK